MDLATIGDEPGTSPLRANRSWMKKLLASPSVSKLFYVKAYLHSLVACLCVTFHCIDLT